MSAVHKEITEAAYRVLSKDKQLVLEPHLEDLYLSCGYPDIFADKSKIKKLAAKIDPDVERFLWPDPPLHEPWYKRVMDRTAEEATRGLAPMRWSHLVEHYLRESLEALQRGDNRRATKYMGVYSHVIGDTTEPIHAVHPHVVDLVVPPPPEFIGFELHAGTEMLCAPVNIDGYEPKLLGKTIKQAAMGALGALCRARDVGAALIVPITQAIYAKDRKRALALSSEAQNESARAFADFVHTVFWMYQNPGAGEATSLDLTQYPWFAAHVDMLYRFRPQEFSLVPYEGTSKPLALPAGEKVEEVKGLGVLPFLGPPYIPETRRNTEIEYYLVPGAFEVFKARVGVNPLFEDTGGGIVFRVLVDGVEKFVSDSLTIRSSPAEITLPLGDARWLSLQTECSPNANDEEMAAAKLHLGWAAHGVWAEPRLESSK